ncbi:hypothetical protein QVD17_28695 [Tagetes erecta]|uniref:Uncharacterized protein n=1 Tax=Tagetes erecta TaxID=13708 RepID=A0AAD8NSY9_TARER|nr:hypothetical protein QVD17_28695 [Tagetes erecta]
MIAPPSPSQSSPTPSLIVTNPKRFRILLSFFLISIFILTDTHIHKDKGGNVDESARCGFYARSLISWQKLFSMVLVALHVAKNTNQLNLHCIAHGLQFIAKVKHVYYPCLKSHPEHEIAKKQMIGFGGVVDCDLDSLHRIFMDVKALWINPSLCLTEYPKSEFASHSKREEVKIATKVVILYDELDMKLQSFCLNGECKDLVYVLLLELECEENGI